MEKNHRKKLLRTIEGKRPIFLELSSTELFSFLGEFFIMSHYPKSLYFLCFPPWNPPSYQIPPESRNPVGVRILLSSLFNVNAIPYQPNQRQLKRTNKNKAN